jgi:Ca2+/Na+ antiporter
MTLLATVFLSRGRLTRGQGAILLCAYVGYIAVSVLVG